MRRETATLLLLLTTLVRPSQGQSFPTPIARPPVVPGGIEASSSPVPSAGGARVQAPVRVTRPDAAQALTPYTSRAFTYQGLLRASGLPLNGPCDLGFTAWSASSGGVALSGTQFLTTSVSSGLFTVQLNDAAQFPDSVFDGREVWIGIDVRSPSGSGPYTTLSPRQRLTATPVASTLAPHATIRAGDTFTGSPALTVDGRPELWGNPEALRAVSDPSNRWLSFGPVGLFADSDAGTGVVGVTRAGVGVFGGAVDTSGWAGYFTGNVHVSGKLQMDRFRARIAINSTGPLPLSSAAFATSGGTLLLNYSGSGYTAVPSRLVGMSLKLDGTLVDQTGIFANQSGMHLAFVSKQWVLTGIPAGNHTLTLEALSGTTTDFNDIFNVTVTELPF